MKSEKSNNTKVVKSIVMVLGVLAAIYLGISVYFINHFYFGTEINSISVVGKTVEQANNEIQEELKKYSLKLEGRGDVTDTINGSDIDLNYNPQGKIDELKNKQQPFLWVKSLFTKDDNELNNIVTFNEESLKSKIKELSFVNNSKVVQPENAKFEYKQNKYEIVEEIKGNLIDEELLYNNIYDAISSGKTTLDLDEVNSYVNPKYTKDSSETVQAKETLDSYISSKINYNLGSRSESVDGETINKWLSVDDSMNVHIDEDKVRMYAESLARKYNTFQDSRDFTTSTGKKITIGGGNYGWIVNKSQETKELIDAVKEGKEVTKELAYSQTAISREKNDIGNTYLEVDLSAQHVWFYKDGNLIADGNVVTGNAAQNTPTKAGVFRLTFKAKNFTLKGEDYESHVNYWMPFDGNIGFHDASWRDPQQFTNNKTYLSNGSHGCVNAPLELAEKIYPYIEEGDPVICY